MILAINNIIHIYKNRYEVTKCRMYIEIKQRFLKLFVLSHHMKILVELGIVTSRKETKRLLDEMMNVK